MKRPVIRLSVFCCLSAMSLAPLQGADQELADTATVRKLFQSPPREYATAPLWVWNDMLSEEQIRGTLRDLAGQQVRQAFVHPRPGLMTPYLSDEWFRLWKIALDEARQLDMNIWIYDENSYPSGFAGGHVPEAMPEARGRGLVFEEKKEPPALQADTLAVYRVGSGGVENVTAAIRQGKSLPAGSFLVASVRRAKDSPWHGNRCYVDLMYPGVTEKFLEITLEAYKREIGDQFGKRVLGSFTDEPNVRPAGGLPWTDHLPVAFQQRWGYNLLDHLPSLQRPVGKWKQVRHDYFQVVLEQFIDHWARPYYRWCERNGIAFTGHYWDHEWPNCIGVTDNMAMSAWQQMPAIDCLMNQYREDTHAQFGNVRFVKEVQSVCNQLGRERFVCEVYGAGGWDLRFEDMKRIADWLGVLGVNFFDEHLSYITLRGARKADHPQSFSYHEPWWDSYHVMAEYLTRLSVAMSQGRQRNRILVIQPTTTAWLYQADPTQAARLQQLGRTFFDLLMALERAQVEYDIGCEDVMARHGSVPAETAARLRVGQATYDTVVLPPGTETLRSETMKQLEQYAVSGGRILCCGSPPALVDARPSDRGGRLAASAGWQQVDPSTLPSMLTPTLARDGFAVRRADGDQGILFHHRRQLADGQLLLLVNTHSEHPSRGSIQADAQGIRQWDLRSGEITAYPFSPAAGGAVQAAFELPPCGSLLLLLTREPVEPPAVARHETTPVPPSRATEIRRVAPNVLTLDYVDITVGDKAEKGLYFYRANHLAWQEHGLPRNPWDSAVQYRDELISQTFPPDSGFEVSYRFTIDGAVPEPLQFVVERADLYEITCNGRPIQAAGDAWWLDKAFARLDLTGSARTGDNVVTLRARPFTMFHEIAPAYVLGDFALRPAASGFVIEPPRPPAFKKALAHATDIEGVAWLTSGVGYQRDPNAEEGNDRSPFIIFDLGRPVDLAAIEVWNYNEATLPGRGVKSMSVHGAAVPDELDTQAHSLGRLELDRAPGGPAGAHTALPQMLAVTGRGIRYVKFTILSNHHGVQFPLTGASKGDAFVGLSEVRFWAAGRDDRPARVAGVKVHAVSSELVRPGGHDRRAVHVIDGSGLAEAAVGWNQQGMPCYADGVTYRQSFEIDKPSGQYVVSVPRWYGSVAKIVVNGRLCGHLVARPWEVDVTDAVKPGENTVEVMVIGTLKNTLGPHHGGAIVGAAWPGMFRQGPEHGPPPGSAYHTLGYGLFEPFELLHVQ